jgi:hypothetical protein
MGSLFAQSVGPLRVVYRHNSLDRRAVAQTLYRVEMGVVRRYGDFMDGEKVVIIQG